MSKLLSAIGIVLVLIGTVFSLWSILGTKPTDVGTSISQIIGLFL